MGCDELFFTISNVQNWIREQLMTKNRTGELNEYLESIGYIKNDFAEDEGGNNASKVLVIGESSCDEKELKGIVKALGLSKDQVVFELDYDKFKHQNIQSYRYSKEYSDILIGPTPHNAKGIEGNSSLVAEIENNPSVYPKLTRIIIPNGKLKISKTAFKEALMKTKAYQFVL